MLSSRPLSSKRKHPPSPQWRPTRKATFQAAQTSVEWTVPQADFDGWLDSSSCEPPLETCVAMTLDTSDFAKTLQMMLPIPAILLTKRPRRVASLKAKHQSPCLSTTFLLLAPVGTQSTEAGWSFLLSAGDMRSLRTATSPLRHGRF